MKCYDPRDPAQNLYDPTTWKETLNPALIVASMVYKHYQNMMSGLDAARARGDAALINFWATAAAGAQLLGEPAAPVSTTPKTLNLNDTVWVKLTERGRKFHKEKWEKERVMLKLDPAWTYRPPVEDARGWSEWQLWHLFEAFGEDIHIGCDPPFETTISLVKP